MVEAIVLEADPIAIFLDPMHEISWFRRKMVQNSKEFFLPTNIIANHPIEPEMDEIQALAGDMENDGEENPVGDTEEVFLQARST